MKKKLLHLLWCVLCVILGAALTLGAFCLTGTFRPGSGTAESGDSVRSRAVRLALAAAADIKNLDYAALGALVSPEKGLVFTPYSTVNLSSDRWFTASELEKLGEDTAVYTWGTDPSTGTVTEMTVQDYFRRVLGDYDYTSSPVIGVNYIAEKGNALENVTEVFPGAVFVDLHNPGTDGRWTTLRLVFEEENDTLWLVAVIHCQYTI